MKKNFLITAIWITCVFFALAAIQSCAGSRGMGCPSHTGKNYKVGY